MDIVVINGKAGTYSWTDGFRFVLISKSVEEEAKKNPEAVINRLLNEGRIEEAERILDTYV